MVFKRELKRNMKGLIIWGAILSGLILMMLSIYPQFAADQQAMNDMLEAYPEQLKKAFGMDSLNMGTLIGFYGIEVYMFTTLLGSVYAALLASGILVKEESEKTIEFLLSKPITRIQIVAQKLGGVLTNLVLLNALMVAVSLIGFSFADEAIPVKSFTLLAVGTFLLHLTMAAIAFLLSAFMRKNRSIVAISLGVVFLSYALQIVSGVSETMAGLRHFSFFHYIDAAEVVGQEAIEGVYILVMALVIVSSIAASFLYYNKKDIAV